MSDLFNIKNEDGTYSGITGNDRTCKLNLFKKLAECSIGDQLMEYQRIILQSLIAEDNRRILASLGEVSGSNPVTAEDIQKAIVVIPEPKTVKPMLVLHDEFAGDVINYVEVDSSNEDEYFLSDEQIKKMLKYEKNPMRIKQLNKMLYGRRNPKWLIMN